MLKWNKQGNYILMVHFPLVPSVQKQWKTFFYFFYLWGKPGSEEDWVNCYTSGDVVTFKQDEAVPMNPSHKQYMEAITASGKYFFTNLCCYSIRSCERLSDKWYRPSDITHHSESSDSHAFTTAMPVRVDGLDTWKPAWTEGVSAPSEQHPPRKWNSSSGYLPSLLMWMKM